jgi:hypothetical protein
MVRRTDRPLGQVRVSFETTRFGPLHLSKAYELLVPEVRRARRQAPQNEVRLRDSKTMSAKIRRGER